MEIYREGPGMRRKICIECNIEESDKHRLVYAGSGQWVCAHAWTCAHRKERSLREFEKVMKALERLGKPEKKVGFSAKNYPIEGFFDSWYASWSDPWPDNERDF